jgi:phosphoglycerol transferase MdoB-like AlkP superfamily enzyme
MLVLIFYILPIIIIGVIVYCDMEHGQTLKEYVKVNDFEVPAVFTFVPIVNLIIVLATIGMIVWHYISNFKKP